MTIQGAMNELVNLLNADDIPIYYKGSIKKVIETIDDYIKRKTEPTTEDCSTVPTSSKMEQVQPQTCSVNGRPYTECCNCEYFKCTADEPQTERIKTPDYCDICNHKGCGNCIANNLDDYCVPSGYEPTTQTETQNSNLTFDKRTMRDCYNCKKYETEGECIECHYEPKTEDEILHEQVRAFMGIVEQTERGE